MTVVMLDLASADLTEAFEYYERQRPGLGFELVTEFRRAVDLIVRHPTAWNPLDEVYRRYRLHRVLSISPSQKLRVRDSA